jgi:hypothetical protein
VLLDLAIETPLDTRFGHRLLNVVSHGFAGSHPTTKRRAGDFANLKVLYHLRLLTGSISDEDPFGSAIA